MKWWFQLVSEDGEALALTDFVENLAAEADAVTLRNAVKAKYNDGLLEEIDSAQLKVYENRAAYQDKTRRTFLRSSRLVAGLGECETQAMIVEVAPLRSLKRQKTLWQRATTLDPTASVLPLSGVNDRVWRLDRAAIAGFGIPVPGDMLPLFCREDATKLVEFLRDDVVRDGRTGYVSGPTGSGKSAASVAFALALAHTSTWVVTWIQLFREEPPICVRLEDNSKKTTALIVPYLEDLSTILNEVDGSKQHIAFLDGVVGDGNRNEVMVCTGWLRRRWDSRRLVVISSPPRTIKNLDDATNLKVEEFRMSSWTLDEYREAIVDEELFLAVEPQLDASDKPKPADSASMEVWRRSLVDSKYYFAGGSARYMFGYSTPKVVSWMNGIIKDVADGRCSIERYNELLGRDRSSGWQTLISRYAGSAVAMFGGPALVKRHGNMLRCDAASRWKQEMHFLARIWKGGVHLYSSERNVFWPEDRFQVLDSKSVSALPVFGWFKPVKYDRGGYDAVCINKRRGLVRFVQLAQAHDHKLDIGCFSTLLCFLRDAASLKVQNVEIFLVVQKEMLSMFTFSEVTGQGLLKEFGWAEGEEVDRARLISMPLVKHWDDFDW